MCEYAPQHTTADEGCLAWISTGMHLFVCVSMYSRVYIRHPGTLLVISVYGDSPCHMAAAWFYEHGKSLVPEDQYCPAVLTINVTLVSNPL